MKIFKNLRLYIVLYFIAMPFLMGWGTIKLVKKIKEIVSKQETGEKTDKKTERKVIKKTNQDQGNYFSTGYSVNTNNEEKVITTAGIIYILPNGNIIHVITIAENIEGRMKETEETIKFLTEHQNEIFNDLAVKIVESGQKSPKEERERKTEPIPPITTKKKV